MKKSRELSERVKLILIMLILMCCVLLTVLVLVALRIRRFYVLAAALILLFLMICSVMYLWLLQPYCQVRKMMNAFNKGIIFEEIFHLPYSLSPEFFWMLEKFHLLIDTEDTLKLSVEQSKYLALQNQINPHFLYNTLDAIRADVLEAGIRDVAKTVEALSNFFGYSITNMDKYGMLMEEIENVKDYMTIQQYRFGDKLKLTIENRGDDDVFEYMIPRMTLQPLVENAIYHGLEGRTKMGTVSLRIHNTDQMLVISVMDDGIGMDAITVDKLNASMGRAGSAYTGAGQKKGGIALKNVNSRIRLLFGDDYGLQIFSQKNVGTDIRIRIPVVKKEDMNEKRIFEDR